MQRDSKIKPATKKQVFFFFFKKKNIAFGTYKSKDKLLKQGFSFTFHSKKVVKNKS